MAATDFSTATQTTIPLTSSRPVVFAAAIVSASPEVDTNRWAFPFNGSGGSSWGTPPFWTWKATGTSSTSLSTSAISTSTSILSTIMPNAVSITSGASPTAPPDSAHVNISPTVITRSIIGGVFGLVGGVVVFLLARISWRRRQLAQKERDREMAMAGVVNPFEDNLIRPQSEVSARYGKGAVAPSPPMELVRGSDHEQPQEPEEQSRHSVDTSPDRTAGDRSELIREMSALRQTMHRVLSERDPQHIDRQLSRPPSYQSNDREAS